MNLLVFIRFWNHNVCILITRQLAGKYSKDSLQRYDFISMYSFSFLIVDVYCSRQTETDKTTVFLPCKHMH